MVAIASKVNPLSVCACSLERFYNLLLKGAPGKLCQFASNSKWVYEEFIIEEFVASLTLQD